MRGCVGVLFALLLTLVVRVASAAEPLFTRISPDLRVYPQYFSIEQDRLRHIYVGGTSGILRFDGSRWSWVKAPMPGAVRALHEDLRGRLWVGGSDCFGYLRKLPDGELEYVDLAPRFHRDLAGNGSGDTKFADIWQIAEYGDRIYFRGLRDLFVVDSSGARVGYWHHEGRFGELGRVGDALWLQWRGEGLRRLTGDAFVPIEGTSRFSTTLIYNLFKLDNGGVLITDVSGELKVFKDGKTETLKGLSPGNDSVQINNGVALGGDRFAFGSFDGAVRVLDLPRRRFESIPVSKSFLPDVIIDDDGALLSVDDQGMIRIEWPVRWLRYGKSDGVEGSIYAIQHIGDMLYLSTGAGVYATPFAGGVLNRPLARMDWTRDEAWALVEDDAGLLLADSRTLVRIKQGRASVISNDDLYPRSLLLDQGRPGYLWAGTEFGPVLLKRAGDGYAEVGRHAKAPWLVSSMAATAEGVLLGSDDNGLAMAIFDPGEATGFRVRRFGTEHGLRFGASMTAIVSSLPGCTVVSTEAGLFRYRENAFFQDDFEGLGVLLSEGEVVSAVASGNGDLWAYSYHSVYRKSASGPWEVALHAKPEDGPFMHVLTQADGDVLVAGNGQLMRYQHRDLGAGQPIADRGNGRATLSITRVRLNHGDVQPSRLPLDRVPKFKMTGASLEFDLALTDFSGASDKRFQFRLEGFDDAWTDAGAQPSVRFFALPPGKYTLHVRASIGNAPPIIGEPYSFEVVPLWYQHAWFLPALVGVASLAAGLALIRRQRRRLGVLRSRNVALDELVRLRTKDLELLNASLQDLADRDGLTGIANRRKFDAFLQLAVDRAQASRGRLGLALIDVDHFKRYNDAHGHQAGDDALIRIASALSESVRDNALIARYGGEEFVIVAPDCGLEEVRQLAERIRVHVSEVTDGMTISIGVSELKPGDTPADLVANADAALYEAKSAGRNRVA